MVNNRMDHVFDEIKKAKGKILALYFPVGDTILNGAECEWAGTYFEGGCTVLEIGLPNENPVLDGKTVADSMERALSHANLDEIFRKIKDIREQYPQKVLQIMVYYQVIEKIGIERFADICHNCDVDGVLSPNTPGESMADLDRALNRYHIHNLRFSPFHLTKEALIDLKANASGYIFQQAVDGATGAQPTVSPTVGENIERLKGAGIETPVLAGFGISNAQQIKEALAMGADGVIVGSAVLSHIIKGDGAAFIKSLGEVTRGL